MSLLSCFKPKHQAPDNTDTQKRMPQEKQLQQDAQRQKNPIGLLEIALKSGWRRQSFTAADPGKVYKGHKRTADVEIDPWKYGGVRKGGGRVKGKARVGREAPLGLRVQDFERRERCSEWIG